ncbi:MAG: zf-HC2 domain-containing protein [Myxococcales bacterium]
MTRHPSELVWTKLLDGALGPVDRLRLGLHLRRCDACRRERDAMLAERAAFDSSPERAADLQAIAGRVPRGVSAQPARSRTFAGLVAGLAAAAALVVLVVARPGPQPPEDDLTAKGGDEFSLVVKRGETVSLLGPRCRAGDALRARLRSAHRHVLVLGIDPAGAVSALHPYSGTSSTSLDPADELTPGSWVLDSAAGVERFVAVFSDSAVSFEQAREALVRSGEAPLTLPGAVVLERSCTKDPTP